MICLCSREIKVRIISIICIVLTLLSALNLIKIAATGDVGYDLPILYNNSYIMAIYVQSSVILVHLFTYILLLLASLYNSKVMLIPTMIITTLQILVIVIISVYLIYLGTFLSLMMLLPVFIILTWVMYILVAVIQFYRELVFKAINAYHEPTTISNQTYYNNHHPQQSFQLNRKHPYLSYNSQPSFLNQPTSSKSQYRNEREPPIPGQYLSLNNDFWEWKQRGHTNVWWLTWNFKNRNKIMF